MLKDAFSYVEILKKIGTEKEQSPPQYVAEISLKHTYTIHLA